MLLYRLEDNRVLELTRSLSHFILKFVLGHLLNLRFLYLEVLTKKLLLGEPFILSLLFESTLSFTVEDCPFLLLFLTLSQLTNKNGIVIITNNFDHIMPVLLLLRVIGDGANRWVNCHECFILLNHLIADVVPLFRLPLLREVELSSQFDLLNDSSLVHFLISITAPFNGGVPRLPLHVLVDLFLLD